MARKPIPPFSESGYRVTRMSEPDLYLAVIGAGEIIERTYFTIDHLSEDKLKYWNMLEVFSRYSSNLPIREAVKDALATIEIALKHYQSAVSRISKSMKPTI